MCILYNKRDATYTLFFIIISAVHVSGGFFRPSSGAHKSVCAALGIFMLPCKKARQYPRLHIQFYKLLMMGGKTARNM
jgi:hypothetical protein